jgi:glycosyltransferase involved in cell wall biosynthesis
VIGDGPERERLVAMARSEGLGGSVRFPGVLQGPAITDELNRHRLIVVPSRYHEPFGIVALEGLACGCLPIVSAEGGLVDAIGRHGLTFRNGDPADLADRLEWILRDPDVAPQLLEGVENHLADFTARRVAEEYVAFFSSLLEPAPDGGRPN